MIILSTKDDELVPHRSNIFEILDLNPIIRELKWENPTIAGGYPLALFAAPRVGKPPGLITRKYYTDIDLYPTDDDHRQRIIDIIEDVFGKNIVHRNETERAKTFRIKITNSPKSKNPSGYTLYNVQVMCMTELEGDVENIFSTYDFIQSVIAMKPLSQEIWFHKELVEWHKRKELQIYKPHCFDPDSPADELIIQLLRIQKYCTRWDYNLSKNTLERIIAAYTEQPDIRLDPGKKYKMDSGRSSGLIANSNANIWKLMSTLIQNSPYWDKKMDVHGEITGVASRELIDMDSLFNTFTL